MKTCQVCSSTELVSLRYGIFVCSKCKNFFDKYTTSRIRRWLPCFQNCDIKKCLYCRLKKCLQAGMNKSSNGHRKYPYNPKKYTNEEIDEILHNAKVELVKNYTMNICEICSRESKNSGLPLCYQCRVFFRKSKVEARQCKNKKDCKLHFTQPRLCKYCRYQKCLEIGWNNSIKNNEMIRKLSLYESTKLDCKADNFVRPDFTVEFRKKRLAVACAIAEKENKFMVSF